MATGTKSEFCLILSTTGGDFMSPMLIGIDVSLRSHHVQFIDGSGNSLASFAISKDRQEDDTLIYKDAGDRYP